MKFFYSLFLFFLPIIVSAQFAPQAELIGSTAIHKDSNIIIAWGDSCIINRGWQDIADTSLGKTTIGNIQSVLGVADGNVLSLGDGGEATYFFANPISNGPGFDFAIFENGFRNPTDSNLAFLELGEVSVSINGIDFYTFPANCNNDTTIQIAGAGDYMDARNIHNLAGKYIANYGTPFDLEELSLHTGLNFDFIHFVKIKDIIGSIDDTNCNRDSKHNKINDPYPTPYPSGGFDLDAIAVIHQTPLNTTSLSSNSDIQFYPNPSAHFIQIKSKNQIKKIATYSIDGIKTKETNNATQIDINELKSGLYILIIEDVYGTKKIDKFIKQ